MRKWGLMLTVCAVLLGACRGDSDDGEARTDTTRATTSTTLRTEVEGITVEATTTTTGVPQATTTTAKSATTPTTTRTESTVGVTVADAPRDAHTETTDNGGDLTYGPQPRGASSTVDKPGDPLTFGIACQVAADGHGTCHLHLVNHVTRAAQFPGGLKIVIRMQRKGGAAYDFEHFLPSVTMLKPGEEARVEATFDLTEQGDYSYAATTTVAWP